MLAPCAFLSLQPRSLRHLRDALGGLAIGLAAIGCGDDSTNTGGGGSGGSGGADSCSPEAPAAAPSDDACERMPGGPPGLASTAVDLSTTHALVRFFGPITSVDAADQGLVAGLLSSAALDTGDLSDYAAELPGVLCARSAAPGEAALGPASVELRGSIAWVRPGTGPVSLPAEATAVVVDLRGLPDVDGLGLALDAAVAPALMDPVARVEVRVRRHTGLTDEVFSATNVYSNDVATITPPPIEGTGSSELALGVATDAVMPPAAAALAISLRVTGRAFIIGEDVRADVAESRWQGVGAGGAYVRTSEMRLGDAMLADLVPADRRSDAPDCVAEEVLAAGQPPAVASGAASRPAIEELDPFGELQPPNETLADAQAALIVGHGAARSFFPYFAVVGDTIDARLDETLASLVEPLDRRGIRNTLRRLGEALHDGHMFVFDDGSPAAGHMPVVIEDIDGQPVVRRSLAVGIDPGDTITSIDGVTMEEFYAAELARSGGASPGYKFDIASRELTRLYGEVSVGLRDADGAMRTVDFSPQPTEDVFELGFAPSLRTAGFLADLGAPALYYINLADDVLTTDAQFTAAMMAAQSSAGLVIDMRGYPGIDHYAAARRLIDVEFSSPVFRVETLTGPDDSAIDESSYPLTPNNPYAGPIVLLVGHHSVSAAENFSTMLVDAGAVTVIGRNSAATNGNITGIQLPGRFQFTFTGMDVRHADEAQSVFHGVGIVPAAETELTAADFRDGVDPELVEAVAVLQAL